MSTPTLADAAISGVVPPTRRWLTQAEGAERLGITDRTIRNLIARGELTGYRVGRSKRMIRVDAREIDSLLTPIPTVGGDR